MTKNQQAPNQSHAGLMILGVLGAGVGAAAGWLWARARRDRLVAEVGSAVHAETSMPDAGGSEFAGSEPAADAGKTGVEQVDGQEGRAEERPQGEGR